jgi:alditol oxidase
LAGPARVASLLELRAVYPRSVETPAELATGRTNWAGNHTYFAGALLEPESFDALQDYVRKSPRLRVLGSRHSFNDIADTRGAQITLRRMPRIFELDREAQTLTVDGGVRYGELCGPLDAAGFALNNLASLPHISVAGACATATHGSGDRIGNLATAVSALEVVTADGELRRFARDRETDAFNGAVVALGGLGVVTSLTLDLQPAFRMRQDLYEYLALGQVVDHFDEITSSADSVSLFTDWRGPVFEQVWLKRRVAANDTFAGATFEPPAEFFGATIATVPIHPIRRMSAAACTEQLGVAGPWHERLPHFRMDHMPSSGDELENE